MGKLSLKNFFVLTLAGIINAIGVTLILAPVKLFDSGISGTAFLLDIITPEAFTMSIFLIILNVPFYLLGFKKLGKEFVVYSLYAITIYSLGAYMFMNVLPIDFSNGSPITGSDLLISAIFGGLISGIGSGLVIRFDGAIDGVEVMAVLFARKIGVTVGTFIMIYNITLYLVSALIFSSWLIPLYSIIAYTVGIKSIDFIVEGLDKAKAVFIITDTDNKIPDILSEELGRGVTVVDAKGHYSNTEKTIIYCVVNRFEILKVKHLVEKHSPDAFVTINEVSETIGGEKIKFRI